MEFDECLNFPQTLIGSLEWEAMGKKEATMGPDAVLEEILAKKLWSNIEIIWVIKRLVYFYGRKDELLKKAPVDRLFMNMVDMLRVFYVLFDSENPEMDDNMRSYISSKLADASWGVSRWTREYLTKM